LASGCSQAAQAALATPQAEELCTRSLNEEQLAPLDRAGTYVNRGVIRLRNRRYDEAIVDFDTAIRYKPNLAEAYVNRAAARIGLLRFNDALSDLDNALMLDVKEPQKAWYNRAVAHEYLDDYKDAYFDYQKAIALAPDWSLPRQQLARFSVSHPLEALPVAAPLQPEPKP
jgi:tetratricopeptide (TPR) repeat protein